MRSGASEYYHVHFVVHTFTQMYTLATTQTYTDIMGANAADALQKVCAFSAILWLRWPHGIAGHGPGSLWADVLCKRCVACSALMDLLEAESLD